MAERLVIGVGPDALRAAAVRAALEGPVTLVQQGPGGSGLEHPDLPLDSGRLSASPSSRGLAEQVLGPLVEAPAGSRGVLLGGRISSLPLRRRGLLAFLPPAHRVELIRGWLRARRAIANADLTGTDREERTYKDWVVRRMGEPAWTFLIRDWVGRRAGVDPELLGAPAARWAHATPDPGPHQVPGGRPHVALEAAEALLRARGGRVLSHARPVRLHLAGGRVRGVELSDGQRLDAAGPVWVARAPATVLSWLPQDLAAPLVQDAARLPRVDLVVVCLKGEVDGLPETLHVLDAGAPFFTVLTPYGIKEYALFLSSLPSGAPTPALEDLARRTAEAARRLGVGEFTPQEARMERAIEHLPVWTEGAHARFHRLVNLFGDIGILTVGRRGAMCPLDVGQEIELAAALAGQESPDLRGALRAWAEPPPRQDDLHVALRPFIHR